ncbi:hypothetical protein [Halalkalibacter alkaliphilus]|uniref:Uncharacterized protein n=1 Tax=Halalkalibacter alkaliphilus TaxID=2917993 RepID=A0A9X1ZYF0_9BACI|nr:hypothetical protein [Halalkalibacter alkaliphilus]MCL7746646.1 hypothetical protein [Halalkalibacter alkaliphilus]
MPISTDGLLETILCGVGRILLILLLELAIIVADLFGFNTGPIVTARNAIATAPCP